MKQGYHTKAVGQASWQDARSEEQFVTRHGKAVAARCYDCADRTRNRWDAVCKRADCLVDEVAFEQCSPDGEWSG